MRTHTFVITAQTAADVSAAEFASHLRDAHRRAVGAYHVDDPLAGSPEIEVLACAWPRNELLVP